MVCLPFIKKKKEMRKSSGESQSLAYVASTALMNVVFLPIFSEGSWWLLCKIWVLLDCTGILAPNRSCHNLPRTDPCVTLPCHAMEL